VQRTRQKLKSVEKLTYVCADAENLPFKNQSIELIISNLALQWCQQLASSLEDFKRILIPHGQLLFSTFGSNTLQELKIAWKKVDNYQHVNEFYTLIELKTILESLGYRNLQLRQKHYISYYASVIELLRELKAIGANTVTAGRNPNMTSATQLQTMISAYPKNSKNSYLSATFEVIFVSAEI
jgi:malonyl-CoA O-methyltransferase